MDKEQAQDNLIALKEYSTSWDISEKTLAFLCGHPSPKGCERTSFINQAMFDALAHPELMAEKLLMSTMVGAHEKSTMLFLQGCNTKDERMAHVFFKYASRFTDAIPRMVEALARLKGRSQKITVERINIEQGAQAIVGSVSNGKM